MNLETFKWDLFTTGQCDIIRNLIAKGEYDAITKAVRIETPDQEAALEELFADIRPIGAPIESQVRAELNEALAKNQANTVIDTPEKEAEWQKKIDEENKANEEKIRSSRKIKKSKKSN